MKRESEWKWTWWRCVSHSWHTIDPYIIREWVGLQYTKLCPNNGQEDGKEEQKKVLLHVCKWKQISSSLSATRNGQSLASDEMSTLTLRALNRHTKVKAYSEQNKFFFKVLSNKLQKNCTKAARMTFSKKAFFSCDISILFRILSVTFVLHSPLNCVGSLN